jgi:HAD superfamily hydrolase (TIGR01509 family)
LFFHPAIAAPQAGAGRRGRGSRADQSGRIWYGCPVRWDLIIFDCDGVLVDSEPIANRVLSEQLAVVGLALPVAEVMRRFVGRTKAGCLELAAEMLRRPLPGSFAADWDEALFAALRSEVRPVEGMAALLAELRVPFCVATNSSPERLRIALDASGLAEFFEGRMFSAAAVPRPKPAPDLFLHAAITLGAAPERCAVIEDTPTGVQAARAAGMAAFGFAGLPHASAAALEANGATVFRTMNELAALLRDGDAAGRI